MIAVINNCKRQYDHFIKSWVCLEDRNKFCSIRRCGDATGLLLTDVIRIGSYYENRDHEQLYAEAITRIRK